MRDIQREQWQWLPHAMHFMCSDQCLFRLATIIGKVVVSTIGEYSPQAKVREILKLSADEFAEIGYKRKYETMVFALRGGMAECGLCPRIHAMELDVACYNEASDAMKGHLDLCEKWAKADIQEGVGT